MIAALKRTIPNILLVRKGDEDEYQMLEQVTTRLQDLGIRTRLVWDQEPKLRHFLWSLTTAETVVISFRPIRKFLPSWAKIFQQKKHDKISEYENLKKAGIPTPKWKEIRRDEETLNLSDFPNFVVVKPANGSCGALV